MEVHSSTCLSSALLLTLLCIHSLLHIYTGFIYLQGILYFVLTTTVNMEGWIDPNAVIDAFEALELKDFSHVYERKTHPSNFRIVHPLAKGGYGEVFLVERDSKVYAMKRVPKSTALQNVNSLFFMDEKQVMTTTKGEWLVHCHLTLQDDSFLYYIMDFIPGGDLMTLITKLDRLSIQEIRFYGSEIIAAVSELHSQGWVHRDLKPENVLLEASGHIKLGDFGTSTKLVNGKATSSFTVGTPDYVSRDLLVTVGNSVTYGPEVDYWTIGVILYELFTGGPPFYSDTLKGTYAKITNIEYVVPEDMPEDLKDLISNLLCDKEKRFGIEEIKRHRFFEGIKWESLKSTLPPHIPKIKNRSDASNFSDLSFSPDNTRTSCGYKQFIGFTYDPEHALEVSRAIRMESEEECGGEVVEFVNPNGSCTKNSHERKALEARIRDITLDVEAKRKELEETCREVEKRRRDLPLINAEISRKKDEYEVVMEKLHKSKEELREINDAIAVKSEIADSLSKIRHENHSGDSLHAIHLEDLRSIQRKLEWMSIGESLVKIKKIAYWFYKENERLRNEIVAARSDEGKESDLKKELRVIKTEVREYQQKFELEAGIRARLEEEVAFLKSKIQKEKRVIGLHIFKVIDVSTNDRLQIYVNDRQLEVRNESETLKKSWDIENLYIRELKNNEFHHLSYKKRALALKIFFLKEIAKSSSSGTRRSLKALEEELGRELKILKGLDDLMNLLDGKTRKEALLQREGSTKKIQQLKQEIEVAKKSTITEYEVGDDEKVYEFNNHLFYEKTIAKGSLCDHCNEVIYGIINQAFCCKDCHMIVHKACYVLGDVSCELNRAINLGTSISVICSTLEDKEKLVKVVKFGSA